MKTTDLLGPRTLLALLALAMLVFTLVPPATYTQAMGEPDLMFANLRLYLFLAGSLATLALGVRIGEALPGGHRMRPDARIRIPTVLQLLPPAVVAIALLALTVKLLLEHNAAIPGLLLAGRAEDAKIVAIHASQGAMTGSLPCAIATLWWLVLRNHNLPSGTPRTSRLLSLLIMACLAVTLLGVALLLVARSVLLPALFGVLLIHLAHRTRQGRLNARGLALLSLLAGAATIGIFAAFAFARGFDTTHAVLGNLIGYGPGSINHLAALLDGKFDTTALAVYLKLQNFGFIYHFPYITRLTGATPLDLPALASAFTETAHAGLNGSYIWMTAFGELWAGVRWWALPYLLVVGLLFGWAWRGFRAQQTFSTLLYCWMAFGVLFYFGANYLASGYFSDIVVTGLALGIYDELIGAPRSAMARVRAP